MGGEIVYDSKAGFEEGTGDGIWDYAFVVWQQEKVVERSPDTFRIDSGGDGGLVINAFEVVFIIAIVLFAGTLIYLCARKLGLTKYIPACTFCPRKICPCCHR